MPSDQNSFAVVSLEYKLNFQANAGWSARIFADRWAISEQGSSSDQTIRPFVVRVGRPWS